MLYVPAITHKKAGKIKYPNKRLGAESILHEKTLLNVNVAAGGITLIKL